MAAYAMYESFSMSGRHVLRSDTRDHRPHVRAESNTTSHAQPIAALRGRLPAQAVGRCLGCGHALNYNYLHVNVRHHDHEGDYEQDQYRRQICLMPPGTVSVGRSVQLVMTRHIGMPPFIPWLRPQPIAPATCRNNCRSVGVAALGSNEPTDLPLALLKNTYMGVCSACTHTVLPYTMICIFIILIHRASPIPPRPMGNSVAARRRRRFVFASCRTHMQRGAVTSNVGRHGNDLELRFCMS